MTQRALVTQAIAPSDAVVAARNTLQRHARTFSLASLFLPPAMRDEAAVLYAWCRTADDAVDEQATADAARAELDQFELDFRERRGELHQAMHRVLQRNAIAVQIPLALLEGMRTDLDPVAFANDRQLLRYCYRAAGTVGLMMCALVGGSGPEAWPFAIDLGIAMQLTNICRDVTEDAMRGRRYLPSDRLHRASETVASEQNGNDKSAIESERCLNHVRLDLLDLADEYYASARAGLHYLPWRQRIAICIAADVYRAIGDRIRAQPDATLHRRAVVSPSAKALLVLRASARAAVSRRYAAPHRAALHAHLHGLPGVRLAWSREPNSTRLGPTAPLRALLAPSTSAPPEGCVVPGGRRVDELT